MEKKIKRIVIVFVSLFLMFVLTGMGNAITFDEVPLGTLDPTIEEVSFWAGNPISWNDTYTDDWWSPGNPYLASGYDDGTGNSPGLYDTFIGVSLTGPPFASCSFEIISEYSFPPSTTLWAVALSSGIEVAETSLTVSDNSSHTMSLSYASGFDTLYIYDDLVAGFGEPFHIDNFRGQVIPEPSTMLLLGSGIIGVWCWRRKRKANDDRRIRLEQRKANKYKRKGGSICSHQDGI